MSPAELLRLRLANHYLLQPAPYDPSALVAHLGAVQAQDYPAALWALAQRQSNARLDSLELAFERGDILRTHVLRPTWHFVTPGDIRWMLELTVPRIRRSIASRERQLGLDAPLAARSNAIIVRALEGGRALTR